MAPWQVGLVVMMTVGVAVIIFGVLWDRERNRQRAGELRRAPDRAIPGYAGPDPAYVSGPAPRDGSLELGPERRDALERDLRGVPTREAGLASPRFVTDPPSRRAVLDHPLVAVCAEPVATMRELLPVLTHASQDERALVVVAPGYAPEVLATLVANHEHRVMRVLAVVAFGDVLTELAEASGATALSQADLQSGWAPAETLGAAVTWVSSTEGTWVL